MSNAGSVRQDDTDRVDLLTVTVAGYLTVGGTIARNAALPITPRLSRQLHDKLGAEAAEDLVTWMQKVDAKRGEFRDLSELQQARVDARFAETRETMRSEIADLRSEMRAEFANIRQDMLTGFARADTRMSSLETRFERRFGDLIKWSFVFWVGAVGAIAMLAGVLP